MSLLLRRRALMSLKKGILPQSYKQVEYIESKGTQWIDTGVIANGNTKVDIDFQITTITASFIFGSRESISKNIYDFKIDGNSRFVSSYGQNSTGTIANANNNRHIVNKNHCDTYYDGVLKHQYAKEAFTTPETLELFATYNGGAKGYLPARMKLYSCAIYNGVLEGERTLLREFVPCYRKGDKEAGLFDLVSGTFFENQGTGSFLIGGEI